MARNNAVFGPKEGFIKLIYEGGCKFEPCMKPLSGPWFEMIKFACAAFLLVPMIAAVHVSWMCEIHTSRLELQGLKFKRIKQTHLFGIVCPNFSQIIKPGFLKGGRRKKISPKTHRAQSNFKEHLSEGHHSWCTFRRIKVKLGSMEQRHGDPLNGHRISYIILKNL